tara:strand:- start:350 stop:568 length:219 start_codon:yes stop_codon:yes gene_type:complete
MIDVIENSNAPVCDYNLVSSDGEILSTARLTKLEASMANFAFGLNHIDKRYELVWCDQIDNTGPRLILPTTE